MPAGTSAKSWYIECQGKSGHESYGIKGPPPPGEWVPPGYYISVSRQSFSRCVSHDFYRTLVQKSAGVVTPLAVDTNFTAEPGKQYGFEATVTTEDSREVVVAQILDIETLRADGMPIGGKQTCSGCAQIDINAVPAGTSKIRVHIGLENAVGIMLLYLTSMLVSGLSDSWSYSQNVSGRAITGSLTKRQR